MVSCASCSPSACKAGSGRINSQVMVLLLMVMVMMAMVLILLARVAVDHVQAHFAMGENSLVCFGCSERELDHALFQPHHVVASHKTTLRREALNKPTYTHACIW